MKVFDRDQAQEIAGYSSLRRTNERLLELVRSGLLRPIRFGSGEPAAYTLPGLALQQRGDIPTTLFLRHRLAVNSIYLGAKYRALPESARLVRWVYFEQTLSKTVPLIPDGYLEIESPSSVYPIFLEVDLGTEPLSTWHKKTQLYLNLAISGEFTKLFNHEYFRVLVVAHSERRLANIRSTIADSTSKIFWCSSFESINRDGMWSQVWLRPAGHQRLSLL
jgi:hypothetical protein